MVGEYVPINFFYFVIFHVPFYMYVFLTKQQGMMMDNMAEDFTKRIVFRPYTVALMMACGRLSLADVSQCCPKGRLTSPQCHSVRRKTKAQS